MNAYRGGGKRKQKSNALSKKAFAKNCSNTNPSDHKEAVYLFFRWLAILFYDDAFIKKSKTE